jgi:hypothetical protein
MKELLKDITAWFFIAGAIFMSCGLFLTVLSREACGPAAHPAPVTASYLLTSERHTPAPSEQAWQEAAFTVEGRP